MGQEEKIREIIINLKDAREEILYVFVAGEELYLQSPKQNLSEDKITFLKKISFAMRYMQRTYN